MLVYPISLILQLLCTPITITYVGTPYTALILPKGHCKLCCPMEEDDVTFHIYGRDRHHFYYQQYNEKDQKEILHNGKTNVIYIHGFSEQASGPGGQEMKDAFMTRTTVNIILVDWRKLAALPWYDHAIKNTLYVAKAVAKFIDDHVHSGVPLHKFHVIGFSLGAEIAGLVGNLVKSGKLSRITGLDPAKPLYSHKSPDQQLSPDDAHFVDVVHTDGGILGFLMPMGHADFYPNGGTPAQPGCAVEDFARTKNLEEFIACSHSRAWKYYAETVRHPFNFPAAPCHSEKDFKHGKCPIDESKGIYMGYLVCPKLRGTFFLNTTHYPPYGVGGEDYWDGHHHH
ncbi:lipase member H [Cimex lectularius]|uniref:Lipase domain-containing protein n=1 Tax=Cimex lectularius TaxID=79782 RepID=A0A8I6RL58_CIMLE|nr:lipase member H [Cimex lectularius]